MEQVTQQPSRRRRTKLAPWERALRKFWPPIRLFLIGAVAICVVVLLISLLIAAFI